MAVATFTTYQQAAYGFADLVDEIGDADWTAPALGDWDPRALVGHTSRALITVRTYLQRRTDVAVVAGPAQYLAGAVRGARSPTHTRSPAAVVKPGPRSGLSRPRQFARWSRMWSRACTPSTATRSSKRLRAGCG